MICARCGVTTTDDVRCEGCGEVPLLDGRYRLEGHLGQGAFGATWRAVRVSDGLPVCIKELLFHRLTSFEPERMFQREAAVLRQLSLPGVPRYVDHFTVETGRTVSMYLAQELVEGQTLAAEVEGHRYREEEVLAILRELLGILDGLHRLSPPVVHRDVKPANVIRRHGGGLVLVDFGSVKDAVRDSTAGGPTVAGTVGYMAPEQMLGQARPASDLYGAGALAVALLSRRSPGDLIDDRGDLAWEDHVVVSGPTAALLRSLLARQPDRRPATARDAMERVDGALRALEAEERGRTAEGDSLDAATRVPGLTAVAVAPRDPDDDPFAPLPPREALPTRRATREALPPPARSSGRGWGGVAAVLLAIVGVIAIWPNRGGHGGAGAAQGVVDVPAGILGLRLGMTLDQAKRELPEVAAGTQEEAAWASRAGAGVLAWGMPVRLPGVRWSFRTQIADQLSTCHLSFAVDDTLSQVSCDIEGLVDQARHQAVTNAILRQLTERYGLVPPPGCDGSGEASTPTFGVNRTVRCDWGDEGEALSVSGSFTDYGNMGGVVLPPKGTLSIELTSRAQERLEEDLDREQRAEEERRQNAARLEMERKAAEEQKRIKAATGGGRTL